MAVVGEKGTEGVVGEEADGVCEEAEDEAHEEVSDLLFGGSMGCERFFEFEFFCEAEEVGCGGLCDRNCDDVGSKLIEVAEDVAEYVERRDGAGRSVAGDEKVVKGEGEDAGRSVFELGVDFEASEVANDEQRRIVETLVVLVELFAGFLEIAALDLYSQAKKPRFQT